MILPNFKKHLIEKGGISQEEFTQILPFIKTKKVAKNDFLLQQDGIPDCYVEVKSATLAQGQTGMFPDTVTLRGQKHCDELAELSKQGFKAKLLFCVMRESINEFKIAERIDPDYASKVKFAKANGVEVLCYGCELKQDGIKITHPISILL